VGKGFRNIIYTDISRDGLLKGPNFDGIEKMCNVEGARIIASGGITSIDDILAIKETGAEGAIIGKALYAGVLKLEDAIKLRRINMLAKRIIPCLDVKDGRVVKGVSFINLRDAGNPWRLQGCIMPQGRMKLYFLTSRFRRKQGHYG
jgi:phosphoribosylformimino-5-aminoimidazole carboxamide ribonucleotide (ProFAR) isomerase